MNTSLETISLTEKHAWNEFVFQGLRSLDFVGYHHTRSVPILVLVEDLINAELQTHTIQKDNFSIKPHPVIALMFSQTDTAVLSRRDEGSDKPSVMIKSHRIMISTQTWTLAARLKVRYHNQPTIILPSLWFFSLASQERMCLSESWFSPRHHLSPPSEQDFGGRISYLMPTSCELGKRHWNLETSSLLVELLPK